METILLITLIILLGATLGILYLNLRSKPKDENENTLIETKEVKEDWRSLMGELSEIEERKRKKNKKKKK